MTSSSENLVCKEYVLGINQNVRSLEFIDDDTIVYCCGNMVVIWEKNSKKQVFLYQHDVDETIRQIMMSPNRKLIGVAIQSEDGIHKIIFYDVYTYKQKKILSLSGKETVTAVVGFVFSKDCKQCLVLGDEPDYLLSMWNIEKNPKVSAKIRLATPSGKSIRQADICPTDSKVICVTGNGVVRFFKLIDNIFRPITVHLHKEQQNYLHHCWMPSGHVVLATDTNEIVIINNFESKSAVLLENWEESITSLVSYSKGIIIGGSNGLIRVFAFNDNERSVLSKIKDFNCNTEIAPHIITVTPYPSEEQFVVLTRAGSITSYPLTNMEMQAETALFGTSYTPKFHLHEHDKPCVITCIDTCAWKPIIATGGTDKTLRIWNYRLNKMEMIEEVGSVIISLSLHPSSVQILLCFESYVRLDYIEHNKTSTVWRDDIKTNGGSCFSNGGQYFALNIGPIVQVYNTYNLAPICTLQGHTEIVRAVRWKKDDYQLGTIGEDGVLCIWTIPKGQRIVRFVDGIQTFTGGFLDDEFKLAILNTKVGVFILDVPTLSYRNQNEEKSSNFSMITYSPPISIGVKNDSPNSGRVCVQSSVFCDLADTIMHSLHSSPISCACLSPDNQRLFTASEDGSLCISRLHRSLVGNNGNIANLISMYGMLVSEEELKDKEFQIRNLKMQLHDIQHQNESIIDKMNDEYENYLQQLKRDLEYKHKNLCNTCDESSRSLNDSRNAFQNELKNLEKCYADEMENAVKNHKDKIEFEQRRIKEFENSCEETRLSWAKEKDDLLKEQSQALDDMRKTLNLKIKNEMSSIQDLRKLKDKIIFDTKQKIEIIEEDADIEISSLVQEKETLIQNEQILSSRLQEENDMIKKNYDVLKKDFEEHKETIRTLQEKQKDLESEIEELECSSQILLQTLKNKDKEILSLDLQINDVTIENHMLESSNFGKSEEIEHLKSIIGHEEEKLREIFKTNDELESNIKTAQHENENLLISKQTAETKLACLRKDHESKLKQMKEKSELIAIIERRIMETRQNEKNITEMKHAVLLMYQEYAKEGEKQSKGSKVRNIEQNIDVLQHKIELVSSSIENHKRSHNLKMEQCLRENNILQKQLDALKREGDEILSHQNKIVNGSLL